MTQPLLSRETVLDLVPFGAADSRTVFYALRLSLPKWGEWHAGQFVMLRTAKPLPDVLWGRPFSLCLVTRRDLVLFFQVAGRATAGLARLAAGDQVVIWGPLGNAMAMEAHVPTLLLAGGIGIVPFVGYVHTHPTPWDLSMEFGYRKPLSCYPFDNINEKIPVDPHQEKDPADRDAFLALLDSRIREYSSSGLVLACGPAPFLRAVQSFALKHKTRTQLCLETRMACGVGACLGCMVRATVPQDPALARSVPQRAHCADHSARLVQTCLCGPNFWANSVLF
ncbi:MAG: dihydroorotate dehydrogenase electron transfer subunit [Desulfovibrio sp.]|jgi:dihydroorotate dehydrogenase electron transfer subunit|nr:dihydroorotate dehydrogenase electron transfer subunit [Desulfovibrio sp.]